MTALRTGLPRTTRYPARAQTFARSLYEQGRTLTEIQAALSRYGHFPDYVTVKRWVDPEWRRERDSVTARRRSIKRGRRPENASLRHARLLELRSLGLSANAVARVMNHDYGLKLTSEHVRGICGETISKPSLRRLLRGQPPSRGRVAA